jgi:hypothetical protein
MEQSFSAAQAMMSAVVLIVAAVVARIADRCGASVARFCVAVGVSRAGDWQQGKQCCGERKNSTDVSHHVHGTPL